MPHFDSTAAIQALQLQAGMLSHPQGAAGLIQLVSDVADKAQCERVTLGLRQRGALRLVAMSHSGESRFQGRLADDLRAAMEEALDQAAVVRMPEAAGDTPRITIAHERLLQDGTQVVASFPLTVGKSTIGALTLQWRSATAAEAFSTQRFVHQLALLAPVIDLIVRSEPTWRAVWRRTWQSAWHGRKPAARFAWGAGAAVLVLALLWPSSYHLAGKARIEGATELAVSAPVDGFIRAVQVKPGDTVAEGAVLVQLADQDLRSDVDRLAGEVAEHESAYLSALGRSDRSEMAVKLAQMQEAKAQLALASSRVQRAQVRAPMAGVVIDGDLTRSVGAPVRRGDKLMTIAPREQYRVVVDVPERDIAGVVPGQTATLALSALPWDTVPLRVTRLIPVARAVDGDNVFEVEAVLAGRADGLRPGMTGVARIAAGHKPVVVGWAQRLFDALRLRWWQWGF